MARETKNYVPMIHAAIVVAKAPGTSTASRSRPRRRSPTTRSPSTRAVDLRVVAECAEAGGRPRAEPQPGAAAPGHAGQPDVPAEGPVGLARPRSRTAWRRCRPRSASPSAPTRSRAARRCTASRGATARAPRRSPTPTACGAGKRLARGTRADHSRREPAAGGAGPPRLRRTHGRRRARRVGARDGPDQLPRPAGRHAVQHRHRYHTTVSNLRSWNKACAAPRLAAGNTLTVYTRARRLTSGRTSPGRARHLESQASAASPAAIPPREVSSCSPRP